MADHFKQVRYKKRNPCLKIFGRYESVGASTRAIDVLRVFRQHIQSQTFTQTKRLSLRKFIGLCCEPDSNFTDINTNATYDLVVSYTFDHKKYTQTKFGLV
jgi:hypothetical protein